MTGKWTLNGLDLYDVYGAAILKGSYNDMLTPPVPRKRLEHEYIDQDGVSVDTTSALTYQPKRYPIIMAIKADSYTQFWERYNALFGQLSQATSFTLWVQDLGRTFTLLFEGVSKVEKLTPINSGTGKVFAKFEINVLDPMTETNPTTAPELIVITDGDLKFYTQTEDAVSFNPATGKITIN